MTGGGDGGGFRLLMNFEDEKARPGLANRQGKAKGPNAKQGKMGKAKTGGKKGKAEGKGYLPAHDPCGMLSCNFKDYCIRNKYISKAIGTTFFKRFKMDISEACF